MNADQSDPRAESLRDLDRRIIDALVRAQAHLGLPSRSEFARLMDQATGGAGPDVSTFNKWANGSVRPPAWALYLAARVSGLTTAQLLEEAKTGEEPQPEHVARIARNEREIAELRGKLAAAYEREQRQAQKYDEMSDKVEGLTNAVNQFLERRRRQANGGEQAAGS